MHFELGSLGAGSLDDIHLQAWLAGLIGTNGNQYHGAIGQFDLELAEV